MNHRVAFLALTLFWTGCKGKPPVCEPGTEVDVPNLVFRKSAERDCIESSSVHNPVRGPCEAWMHYLENSEEYADEGVEIYPPQPPCGATDFSFTERATGDCLYVGIRCLSILDDPAYGHCSESDEALCCEWGEQGISGEFCPWED